MLMIDPKNSRFDPRAFVWLGSLNTEISTCGFWAKDIRTFDDLKKRAAANITMGAATMAVVLLLVPGRANAYTETVTSDVALQFANSMLRRFDVDWAGLGFTDDDLAELAEHLLRVIQSFVIDPGRPPRRGEALRGYLRRWVGSAVKHPSAATTSSARTRTSSRR